MDFSSFFQNLFGVGVAHPLHAFVFIVLAVVPSCVLTLVSSPSALMLFGGVYASVLALLMLLLQIVTARLHARFDVDQGEDAPANGDVELRSINVTTTAALHSPRNSGWEPPFASLHGGSSGGGGGGGAPSSSQQPPSDAPASDSNSRINIDEEIRMAATLEFLDAGSVLSPAQLEALLDALHSSGDELRNQPSPPPTKSTSKPAADKGDDADNGKSSGSYDSMRLNDSGDEGSGQEDPYMRDMMLRMQQQQQSSDGDVDSPGYMAYSYHSSHGSSLQDSPRGDWPTETCCEQCADGVRYCDCGLCPCCPGYVDCCDVAACVQPLSDAVHSRRHLERLVTRHYHGASRARRRLVLLLVVALFAAPPLLLAALVATGALAAPLRIIFAAIAGVTCQMALIKAPHPDASSPTINDVRAAFLRSSYFCLFAAAALALHQWLAPAADVAAAAAIELGTARVAPLAAAHAALYVATRLLPCLPLFFAIGLLPAPHTALLFVAEQVHWHAFGGSALASLAAAAGSLVAAAVAVAGTTLLLLLGLLLPPCSVEARLLLAAAAAAALALAFLGARWPSDLRLLWALERADDDDDDDDAAAAEAAAAEAAAATAAVAARTTDSLSSASATAQREAAHGGGRKRLSSTSSNRKRQISVANVDDDQEKKGEEEQQEEEEVDATIQAPDTTTTTTTTRLPAPPEPRARPYPHRRLRYDVIYAALIFVAALVVALGTPLLAHPLSPLAAAAALLLVTAVNHVLLPELRRATPFGLFKWPLLLPAAARRDTAAVARMSPDNARLDAAADATERVRRALLLLERLVLLPATLLATALVAAPAAAAAFDSPAAAAVCTALLLHRGPRVAAAAPRLWPFALALLVAVGGGDARRLLWRAAVGVAAATCAPLGAIYGVTWHDDTASTLSADDDLLSYALARLPLLLLLALFVTDKLRELYNKLYFFVVYSSPHALAVGSDAHAFLALVALPHLPLHLAIVLAAAALSLPLLPVLGSALFVVGYARPLRWTEASFASARVQSATELRLADLVGDAHDTERDHVNRLNSHYYEELALTLQRRLAVDVALGRLGGGIRAGDVFVLMNDKLVALVSVVERGAAHVSFQLRGLELQGTYCQQQEVDALWQGNDGGLFDASVDSRLRLRAPSDIASAAGHTWSHETRYYLAPAYSISHSNAQSLFNSFDMRESFARMTTYALLRGALRHPQLATWLANEQVRRAVDDELAAHGDDARRADLFVEARTGLSRRAFQRTYGEFIEMAAADDDDDALAAADEAAREQHDALRNHFLYLLTLWARRNLVPSDLPAALFAQRMVSAPALLMRINSLLLRDVRVESDASFLYADLEAFAALLVESVKFGLRLHLDTVALYAGAAMGGGDDVDEAERREMLETVLEMLDEQAAPAASSVVCHERDAAWRRAVLLGTREVLSLRVAPDRYHDHDYEAFFVRLQRVTGAFTLVRVNPEAVKALWASEQQEILYWRSDDNERGSIQNCIAVLRNLINSSLDPPLGYNVYSSPILNSFAAPRDTFWQDFKAMQF